MTDSERTDATAGAANPTSVANGDAPVRVEGNPEKLVCPFCRTANDTSDGEGLTYLTDGYECSGCDAPFEIVQFRVIGYFRRVST